MLDEIALAHRISSYFTYGKHIKPNNQIRLLNDICPTKMPTRGFFRLWSNLGTSPW